MELRERGLYYVDDVASDQVHQVCRSNSERVKKIWLWYRRLGHASFEYLHKLLPSLFNGVQDRVKM